MVDTFFGVKELRGAPLRKRDLLLFDRLFVPLIEQQLKRSGHAAEVADLEWLLERGLVLGIEPAENILESEQFNLSGILLASYLVVKVHEREFQIDVNEVAHLSAFESIFLDSALRAISASVELKENVRTTPLFESASILRVTNLEPDLTRALAFLQSLPEELKRKPIASGPLQPLFSAGGYSDLRVIPEAIDRLKTALAASRETSASTLKPVIEIVLKSMPVPDESVPWEQIVDFRSDEDVRYSSTLLRQWMRKIAEGAATQVEILEELDFLTESFNRHMRIHRMKQGSGIIETVISAAAEALDNLAHLKLGSAAKALIAFRNRKVTLLEAEQNAPGREVAYLMKVHERFGGSASQ